jgi:hypothetical protein
VYGVRNVAIESEAPTQVLQRGDARRQRDNDESAAAERESDNSPRYHHTHASHEHMSLTSAFVSPGALFCGVCASAPCPLMVGSAAAEEWNGVASRRPACVLAIESTRWEKDQSGLSSLHTREVSVEDRGWSRREFTVVRSFRAFGLRRSAAQSTRVSQTRQSNKRIVYGTRPCAHAHAVHAHTRTEDSSVSRIFAHRRPLVEFVHTNSDAPFPE